MVTRLFVLLALLATACDTGFEKPSIVRDLRVLAIASDPAEVVVNVTTDLEAIVLPPVHLTALIGTPNPGPVAYTMTACPITDTRRCDDETAPRLRFAEGAVEDANATPPIGTLEVDATLLRAALEADSYHGLGGIPVVIELAVTAGDETVYASKRIVYAPRIPATRAANQNPTFTLTTRRPAQAPEEAVPWLGELVVAPSEELVLEPVEPMGVREPYVVPTLDGGERMFTENLRYAWLATMGNFSDEETGGAIDLFGNIPLLRTRWTAPAEPGTVRLWIVQRDERGGTYWTERRILVQ